MKTSSSLPGLAQGKQPPVWPRHADMAAVTEQLPVCMVTFTAASAAEMRERMYAYAKKNQLPNPGALVPAGTFHALALRHYNEHAPQKRRLIPGAQRDAMGPTARRPGNSYDRQLYMLGAGTIPRAIDQSTISFDNDEVAHFVHDYHARLEAAEH